MTTPRTTAANAVQTAVFAALQTAGVTVGDTLPPDTAPPYVQIGEAIELPWRTQASDGRRVDLNLHIWSAGNSFKEAGELQHLVLTTLHWQRVTVDGWTLHHLSFEDPAQRLNDPSGWKHIVQPLRAYCS